VTFSSADRVRNVIHGFNADGFESLYPKYQGGRPRTFTLPERREIKEIAKSKPWIACSPNARRTRATRSMNVERLGPLLLDHGVPPAHIAANASWFDSWWGEDSARHQHLIDYFATFVTQAIERQRERDHLHEFVGWWEAEHGEVTDEELARAEAERLSLQRQHAERKARSVSDRRAS
jgi:hypothetical protein